MRTDAPALADLSLRGLDVIGWDVGGAHLKACWLRDGAWVDAAQWPCPLWQGEQHLVAALHAARERWPVLALGAGCAHAVTMSGEMVDLYPDREAGVARISACLAAQLSGPIALYAGQDGWVDVAGARAAWAAIASANWRATAQHAASQVGSGWLIDVGSTTTDIVAFHQGRVLSHSRTDRDRLASGELVYHGVVRTPLCALASRIVLQGQSLNVMNELFATTADVYRLTGELDPAHDQYPTADGADKSLPATRARLARMVGCDARDARDASEADWVAFAQAWRTAQVDVLAGQWMRVMHILPAAQAPGLKAADMAAAMAVAGGPVVAAGCGAFLVPDLLRATGAWAAASLPSAILDYGRDVARPCVSSQMTDPASWGQVCAPSVAVASLYYQARQS